MATARERAHAEVRGEILDAARRQLGETGAAGLSLRAVAREVGLVSSALYRYFPSRDDLLTALLVSAYESLAAAATAAAARSRDAEPGEQWLVLTRSVRRWAQRHRYEWALLFGSPVPGYRAPPDTIDPATAVPLAMVAILAGVPQPSAGDEPDAPPGVRRDLARLAEQLAPGADEARMTRALMAWTALVGAVSFELHGHLHTVIADYPGWFDHQMRVLGRGLGLAA